MQRSEEYHGKCVVEGGALLEPGFGLVGEGGLALRREGLELVPYPPAQRMEYKEEGQVRDILSEAAVLGVRVVLGNSLSMMSAVAHEYVLLTILRPGTQPSVSLCAYLSHRGSEASIYQQRSTSKGPRGAYVLTQYMGSRSSTGCK